VANRRWAAVAVPADRPLVAADAVQPAVAVVVVLRPVVVDAVRPVAAADVVLPAAVVAGGRQAVAVAVVPGAVAAADVVAGAVDSTAGSRPSWQSDLVHSDWSQLV
jgi:hypothetical protein